MDRQASFSLLQAVKGGLKDAFSVSRAVEALVSLTGGRGLLPERVAVLQAAGVASYASCCKEVMRHAMPAITAALITHSGDAVLVEGALVALRNLARVPRLVGAEITALVPTCVAVLRAHSSGPGVALWACAALAQMAAVAPSARALCLSEDAPSATVAALLAFAGEARVVEQACSALAAFSHESGDGVLANLDAGAAPALVAALGQHATEVMLVQRACEALADLGALPESREAILNAGAASALVAALEAHSSKADVALSVCRAVT